MPEKKYPIPEEELSIVSEPAMLYAVRDNQVSSTFLADIKTISNLTDDVLAKMFDLNIKTFRSYRTKETSLRPHLQEHSFALLALFKHGIEVFGNSGSFNDWLNRQNHYFDNDAPINFLTTISGIKYVDSRLIAIQFGDNI